MSANLYGFEPGEVEVIDVPGHKAGVRLKHFSGAVVTETSHSYREPNRKAAFAALLDALGKNGPSPTKVAESLAHRCYYFKCSKCRISSTTGDDFETAYKLAQYDGWDFSRVSEGKVFCDGHRVAVFE